MMRFSVAPGSFDYPSSPQRIVGTSQVWDEAEVNQGSTEKRRATGKQGCSIPRCSRVENRDVGPLSIVLPTSRLQHVGFVESSHRQAFHSARQVFADFK